MNWQYKTISLPHLVIDREDMLSEMGLNGWELVGFEQGLAYFKRPMAEPVQYPIPASIAAGLGVQPAVIVEDLSKVSYSSQIQRSKKK